jgi:hypothetical protein
VKSTLNLVRPFTALAAWCTQVKVSAVSTQRAAEHRLLVEAASRTSSSHGSKHTLWWWHHAGPRPSFARFVCTATTDGCLERLLAHVKVKAKSVVMTAPAYVVSELLKDEVPAASKALGEIYYPPVGAVTVGFPESALRPDAPPLKTGKFNGFGQLHPRSQVRVKGFRHGSERRAASV